MRIQDAGRCVFWKANSETTDRRLAGHRQVKPRRWEMRMRACILEADCLYLSGGAGVKQRSEPSMRLI